MKIKRIISTVLVLFAFQIMSPIKVSAADVYVSNFTELQAAISNPAVTEIALTASFNITDSLEIDDTKIIDGQGYTLTRSTSWTGVYHDMFVVIAPGDLTFKDITIDGNKANVTTTGTIVLVDSDASFTLDNGATLQNNKAINYPGGAIYAEPDSSIYIKEGSSITLNETGNIYGVNLGFESGGGAIFGDEAYIEISGGTISYNVTDNAGGAISVIEESTLVITGGTICFNTAIDGGGIHVEASTATISGPVLINGNSATTLEGGGIYVNYSGTVTITANSFGTPTIDRNTASQLGGGISVRKSDLYINGAIITNNQVTTTNKYNSSGSHRGGGGIYIEGVQGDTPYASIVNATISNNTAPNGGGVLMTGSGSIAEISVTVFTENIALYDGGAVANSGRNTAQSSMKMTLTDVIITHNEAGNAGGGIWNGYDNYSPASGVFGPDIYTELYLKGTSVVTNNTAQGLGGGIYNGYHVARKHNASGVVYKGDVRFYMDSTAILYDNESVSPTDIGDDAYNHNSIFVIRPSYSDRIENTIRYYAPSVDSDLLSFVGWYLHDTSGFDPLVNTVIQGSELWKLNTTLSDLSNDEATAVSYGIKAFWDVAGTVPPGPGVTTPTTPSTPTIPKMGVDQTLNSYIMMMTLSIIGIVALRNMGRKQTED